MTNINKSKIVAVLLAGGAARRMGGGDKCLHYLAGKSLLEHVISKIKNQVDCMIINANGDPSRFSGFGLDVVGDVVPGQLGPLAGVLSGLDWAYEKKPQAKWVLSVPTDCPLLPFDLVERLMSAIVMKSEQEKNFDSEKTHDSLWIGSCVASGGRCHPVLALWPINWRNQLRDALLNQGIKKIDLFTKSLPLAIAEFSVDPFDPFTNINTPADLISTNKILAKT
tara:strand:- start:1266 stop:1937 length:672 start_codon:yes stop_codon:yes gene_type:complete